jgi:hypothetical protein
MYFPHIDTNPIEMLWQDLKQDVHPQKPTNIAELKQFCMEEWDNNNYRKCLVVVIAAKCGTSSY